MNTIDRLGQLVQLISVDSYVTQPQSGLTEPD
jgi:hypothetical protein